MLPDILRQISAIRFRSIASFTPNFVIDIELYSNLILNKGQKCYKCAWQLHNKFARYKCFCVYVLCSLYWNPDGIPCLIPNNIYRIADTISNRPMSKCDYMRCVCVVLVRVSSSPASFTDEVNFSRLIGFVVRFEIGFLVVASQFGSLNEYYYIHSAICTSSMHPYTSSAHAPFTPNTHTHIHIMCNNIAVCWKAGNRCINQRRAIKIKSNERFL